MLENAVLIGSEIDWKVRLGPFVGKHAVCLTPPSEAGLLIPLDTATQGGTTGCIPYSLHAKI